MHAENQCPDDVRDSIYEAYPEVRDCEPRKYKEGASKGVTKEEGEGSVAGLEEIKGAINRNRGSIREGLDSWRNKEVGDKREYKETEMAMQMEREKAYNKSPSASCYTEYDQ